MPRFFFDTSDGFCAVRDMEGLDLRDASDARTEAIAALPGLARATTPDSDRHDVFCNVRDECGRMVFTATLSMLARWVD